MDAGTHRHFWTVEILDRRSVGEMGFWNGVGKVGNLRAFEYWVLDKREIKENDG